MIANASETPRVPATQFMGSAIRAAVPASKPVCGIAVTATMKEQWGSKFAHIEPWLRFPEAVEKEPLPVIAIFRDESPAPGRDSMIGEGMPRAMRAAGAVAVVCDGCIRDKAAPREMALPVWASGLVADRGHIRFHRYQVPMQIGGMKVNPGDLIHADENGAVVVPRDCVEEVLEAAAQISAKEAHLFAMFEAPGFRVAQLYDFYAEALKSVRAAGTGES